MTAGKVYTIFWRPLAEEDLLSIVRYIAKDNPARARSFGEEIKDKTNSLASMPTRCKPGFVAGTREFVIHKHYLVIFRITKGRVTILRIKHTALSDDDEE